MALQFRQATHEKRRVMLCTVAGVLLLSSCTQLSQRDRDRELLSRFGVHSAASRDSSMLALREEVLRHAPLGSARAVVNAYLDSLGFPDAPSGATRRRTYAEAGAVVIGARLEHHPHHWYDFAPCNYTHEVQFSMDAANRLKDVRIVESGSCM